VSTIIANFCCWRVIADGDECTNLILSLDVHVLLFSRWLPSVFIATLKVVPVVD
jgi:hypothetical protein